MKRKIAILPDSLKNWLKNSDPKKIIIRRDAVADFGPVALTQNWTTSFINFFWKILNCSEVCLAHLTFPKNRSEGAHLGYLNLEKRLGISNFIVLYISCLLDDPNTKDIQWLRIPWKSFAIKRTHFSLKAQNPLTHHFPVLYIVQPHWY